MTDLQSPSSGKKRTVFIISMVAAMVLGAFLGGLARREFAVVTLMGDLFLSGLKMMIVPLIFFSIFLDWRCLHWECG